jgi:hypothetical protein
MSGFHAMKIMSRVCVRSARVLIGTGRDKPIKRSEGFTLMQMKPSPLISIGNYFLPVLTLSFSVVLG